MQLTIGAKRRVATKVEDCLIEIVGQHIKENISILPLGSYHVLIGMEWIEKHWILVICKDKTTSLLSDEGVRK